MRIALSAPDVSLLGGIERVIVESANHLARAGHDVTVVAARADHRVLAEGVACEVVRPLGALDERVGLGFRRRAAGVLRRLRPDVHGAFSALSPLGGVYWVPSVHRVAYDLVQSRRGAGGRLVQAANPYHRVRLGLERSMFAPGGASRILAQTDRVKAEIVGNYGVPNPDVAVLPLGFDPGVFSTAARMARRPGARAQLGYGDDDRVLLFVANELERKGFDTLLDAVAQVGDQRVHILGAGRVAPDAYRAQVERLGLRERLRWVGPTDDVALLHAAADAFVLPTRYEPWGLVIVEALASGLPTITTRLAGAALAVRDGETGRLLEDPDDAAELAEAVRWALSGAPRAPEAISASVDSYAWPVILQRYEAVLAAAAARA
jgi:UDP-glucose:(heptosyl)LPS alpha-1,3-glucosyltransferase